MTATPAAARRAGVGKSVGRQPLPDISLAHLCELHPLLAAAHGARVVVNSSAGHALTDFRWHDPHFRTGYDKWLAYGQAKTANSLFAVHLDVLGRDDGVRVRSPYIRARSSPVCNARCREPNRSSGAGWTSRAR